ncbi:unnamed protein product [Fusarium graminearum]|uniref:Chromosome 3, complete genome n=1 Tax=Gibberella zeae (strain ATCC MYA-4620 / CBS 123657 / FGSC 9075 / NRRL 31084 / PH-1) TaxID=229533 RepID=A0A098DYR6_GIBZE|nr:unnamed protein product [Fusarium graminearum]CZS84944.1 unnamed protein product [Fusarium graminearum]
MYFIITTSRASEIFYQAVTAVPVVTQRKYSNASAVKLPSFDHTASPHTTGPSSGVCVTCPRASKGVDSRVVPCKPASHQEPGTGSATRDSSLNINSSWDLRVCRMERCRLLKGNKVIGMLQSQLLHCNIANSCTSQGSWHSCRCRWRYKSGLLPLSAPSQTADTS